MALQYQLFLRFKDGFVYKTEPFSADNMPGEGKFLDLVVQGYESDRELTLNPNEGQSMTRKYRDLHSVEILFP